eukprot:TRINITY_DN12947_c0_g1_i5.p1 TRINITY_DN12947_c0_g1~~TRINITY_DN12947_c0_g1_i5.p1  ORF type:complete len:323 (+),score=112.91 TRINITY_DN12947_c0_g1_i5:56-970(+)
MNKICVALALLALVCFTVDARGRSHEKHPHYHSRPHFHHEDVITGVRHYISGYFYESAVHELIQRISRMEHPVLHLNSTASNSTICWKQTYGRGVGRAIYACDNGLEKSGLLCYPPCKTNFYGVGPVCWENCEAGFTDEGALCGRAGSITSADNHNCPWYDKCGLTFAKGCSKCPSDAHNDGCTCRIDPKVYAKDSYGRGAGKPLGCGQQQYDAGLCYDYCKTSFSGVGPVCWQECPANLSYSDGALCCASEHECNQKVSDLAKSVLAAAAAAVAAGEDPQQVLEAVKQAIEAVLGFVLPLCDV